VEPRLWTGGEGTDEIRNEIDPENDEPGKKPVPERSRNVLDPEQGPDGDLAEKYQQEGYVGHEQSHCYRVGGGRGARA